MFGQPDRTSVLELVPHPGTLRHHEPGECEHRTHRPLAATLLALGLLAATSGCGTATIDGFAQTDPAELTRTSVPIPAFTDPPTTSRAPYTYVPPPPSPKPESEKNLPFVDAKLPNDCLLTADQGQVLTGLPKLTPRQERIPESDGESSTPATTRSFNLRHPGAH